MLEDSVMMVILQVLRSGWARRPLASKQTWVCQSSSHGREYYNACIANVAQLCWSSLMCPHPHRRCLVAGCLQASYPSTAGESSPKAAYQAASASGINAASPLMKSCRSLYGLKTTRLCFISACSRYGITTGMKIVTKAHVQENSDAELAWNVLLIDLWHRAGKMS